METPRVSWMGGCSRFSPSFEPALSFFLRFLRVPRLASPPHFPPGFLCIIISSHFLSHRAFFSVIGIAVEHRICWLCEEEKWWGKKILK